MSKPEVHANIPQLKGAFHQHGKLADASETSSGQLLRFYGNECGLKALYLKNNRLDSTKDFETSALGQKYGYGHDLLRWVAEIKIPRFVIRFEDNPTDPLVNAHEKLRYGIEIKNEQQAVLKTIHTLLKKHL